MISPESKSQIVTDYKVHEKDTGSPEVQIAILTKRITELTDHLRTHGKDHSSRRRAAEDGRDGHSLLNSLHREDRNRYLRLIARLGLRK